MKVKKQEICPHCGNPHTVFFEIEARRRNRTTYRPVYKNSRLEYAVAEVDEGYEYALPWRRIDDILFYPIGAAIGALSGAVAYMMTDTWLGPLDESLLLSLCSVGGTGMLIYVHWMLMDMSKQERIKAKLLSYWQDHSVPQSEDNKPVVLEVSHTERDGGGEQGRTIQYFGELPCEPVAFNDYVKSIMAGETLAIARWTGADKPFSRLEYEQLLDILRQAGAVVNLPGKGNQLTQHGKRAFTNHLKQAEATSE